MMVMECTPFELLTQGRNMRGEASSGENQNHRFAHYEFGARRHARRREPFGFRSRSSGALDFGRWGRDRDARRGEGGRGVLCSPPDPGHDQTSP